MIEQTHVKIQLLRKEATVPRYATDGSAACDLTAAIEMPCTVAAHSRAVIPTGIALSMPRGTVAVVCARSGLAFRHGLSLVNGIGVIDADYRGEICVGLRNDNDTDYTITPGERIAQLMFLPYLQAAFSLTESLDETERGCGGFGSTGKM